MSLDQQFGEPRGPTKIDPWEIRRKPKSQIELTPPAGLRLRRYRAVCKSPLLRHAAQTMTYIWAMDPEGKVHIAVEELAQMLDGTVVGGYPRRRNYPAHPAEERKLGHPTLLSGGAARIAGELFLDAPEAELFWFVNVGSGRYCRTSPPTDAQVRNILALFREVIEPDVQLDDMSIS